MTAPFPEIGGTDAVFQEASLLKDNFGGDLVTAYPLKRPRAFIPRGWYGRTLARDAPRIQRQYDCVHLYCARFLDFPFLRRLNLPVVYTVSASRTIRGRKSPGWLEHIISADPRVVAEVRRKWGIAASHILPGLPPPAREYGPAPAPPPFIITCASGPWTHRQLRTKGFVLLLETVRKLPDVRLQLIGRGVGDNELRALIRRYRLEAQVTLVTGRVDVPELMAAGHAAVLLAKDDSLVKAYPHSLIEALQVGRPLILNDRIAMADFVREHRCGVVVSGWSSERLAAAITELISGLARLSVPAGEASRCFSREHFFAEHKDVYARLA